MTQSEPTLDDALREFDNPLLEKARRFVWTADDISDTILSALCHNIYVSDKNRSLPGNRFKAPKQFE